MQGVGLVGCEFLCNGGFVVTLGFGVSGFGVVSLGFICVCVFVGSSPGGFV